MNFLAKATRTGALRPLALRATLLQVPCVQSRAFSKFTYKSPENPKGFYQALVDADSTNLHEKVFHYSQYLLGVMVPVAIFTPPGMMTTISDVIIALGFPFHAHIGMCHVWSDYIPKGFQGILRSLTLIFCVLGALGLLKTALTGPGLIQSTKEFWRPKIEDAKKN